MPKFHGIAGAFAKVSYKYCYVETWIMSNL